MLHNGNPTEEYEANMMQRAGLYDVKKINPYMTDHAPSDLLKRARDENYATRLGWDQQQDEAQANRDKADDPVAFMMRMNPTDPLLHPQLARTDIRPKFVVRDVFNKPDFNYR